MLSRIIRGTLVVAVVVLTGACTSEDGKVWLAHNSHFASGDHGFFSLRNNKDGSSPSVRRIDIEEARTENWWGIYAINVSPDQIFQN
jgi:hypothetical protein